MAVGVLSEVPGLTAEMYDAVTAKANVESDPPMGLIVHTAGPMEGGFGSSTSGRARKTTTASSPSGSTRRSAR